MMDADGSNNELILEHNSPIQAINDPMFSPDGKKIIFESIVGKDSYGNPIANIFTVDASGKNLKRLTVDDGEADVLPHFSPDGKKISYFTYTWESLSVGTFQIRTANADGSYEKTISSFPWETAPTWIPQ